MYTKINFSKTQIPVKVQDYNLFQKKEITFLLTSFAFGSHCSQVAAHTSQRNVLHVFSSRLSINSVTKQSGIRINVYKSEYNWIFLFITY